MIKKIMEALARYDFYRGNVPRLKNKYYIEQYGLCYEQAECQAHYTRF